VWWEEVEGFGFCALCQEEVEIAEGFDEGLGQVVCYKDNSTTNN
jgi:hypothetical protein